MLHLSRVYFYKLLLRQLRGCPREDIKVQRESLMSDVNMMSIRHELVSNLSHGMKRRLAILLALIGPVKVRSFTKGLENIIIY